MKDEGCTEIESEPNGDPSALWVAGPGRRSFHVAQTARAGGGPGSGAGLEAPALVAGLDDVAVVGEPVEERGRHLGVAEDGGPFAEVEVRGDDDRGALVEAADQVEQELAAGLGEGKVSQFVEDQEVETAEDVRRPALAVGPGLCAEIDERVQAFLTRPLEGAWPYLSLDVSRRTPCVRVSLRKYIRVRENGRILSRAVILAVGVNEDGRREVLGVATGPSEAETCLGPVSCAPSPIAACAA